MENCLNGSALDRVPVALWRHFPVDDQSPDRLAAATVQFQRTFDFDFVKVTPASSYCLKDWGVKDEWRGATEGTRDYTTRVIHNPDDWKRLSVLHPHQGYLAGQIEGLRLINSELGPDVPVIQTIFNPLTQAKNLVGKDTLLVHLRQYPDAVHEALKVITESTRRFIETLTETGIAGIFYAVQHAQFGLLSEEEYLTFGQYYDLQILESASDFWLNLLHLHGENIMFDQFADYPVAVVNWHDRDTKPSLQEGLNRFPGVVCGGLRREKTLVLGTPDTIVTEDRDDFRATNGNRFILGTGCVVPITAPYGNIMATRHSVESI
jgi:uroporphyrinogen decarboxylase